MRARTCYRKLETERLLESQRLREAKIERLIRGSDNGK